MNVSRLRPGDSADANLLFAVVARQRGFLDQAKFIEACEVWAITRDKPLSDLLLERNWLTPEAKSEVEEDVQRRLNQHDGDVRASLNAAADDSIRQSLGPVFTDPELADLETADFRDSGPRPRERSRDRYVLIGEPKMGGIGMVWRAKDVELGREVALKELRKDKVLVRALRDRFVAEAQVNAQLTHPNIVPAFDLVDPDGETPFYTMQYVEGRTLTEATRDFHKRRREGTAGPLELRELLTAFVTLCKAVDYAHDRGVLHRDLKGLNVILGDHGEVFLLDWGMAKVGDSSAEPAQQTPVELSTMDPSTATQPGDRLGTPSYMAPEQAAGRVHEIDRRTDVYALGVILFEILTGRLPFEMDDFSEMDADLPNDPQAKRQIQARRRIERLLERVQHDVPPSPRSLDAEVPAPLDAVCLKAMQKEKTDRFASAKELAREIEHWLADEPVEAWPEPWTLQARRWVGRHRTIVTSAVASLLLGVVGLAVFSIILGDINDQLTDNGIKLESANTELIDRGSKLQQSNSELADEKRKVDKASTVLLASIVKEREATQLAKTKESEAKREKLKVEAALREVQRQQKFSHMLVKQYFGHFKNISRDDRRFGDVLGLIKIREEMQSVAGSLKDVQIDDPQVFVGFAESLLQLASIARESQSLKEAAETSRQAEGVMKQLVDRFPLDPRFQTMLATIYNERAVALSEAGRYDDGIAGYQKAIAVLEKLPKAAREHKDTQTQLGQYYSNIGVNHNLGGRADDSRPAFLKAIDIFQQLEKRPDIIPAIDRPAIQIASVEVNLGKLYVSEDRYAEATATFERAVNRLEATGRDRFVADLEEYRRALGMSYVGLAACCSLDRDPKVKAKLEAILPKAIAVWESLVKDAPGVIHYQIGLGRSYMIQAMAHKENRRQKEAERLVRKAIANLERVEEGNPEFLLITHDVGVLSEMLGFFELEAYRPLESLVLAGKAIEKMNIVLRAQPENSSAKRNLTQAKMLKAEALMGLGRYKDALKAWEDTPPLGIEKEKEFRALRRALCLAGIGEEYLLALDIMKTTAAKGKLHLVETLMQAQVYSLAAGAALRDPEPDLTDELRKTRANKYAKSAMETLEHELKLIVLFKDENRRERLVLILQESPHFAPIRNRPEFREVLRRAKGAEKRK